MNTLYYGDNLYYLRELDTAAVDLIYLDPPFNSKSAYNLFFRSPEGGAVQAQTTAFHDTWSWDTPAEEAFDDVLASGSGAAPILRALRSHLGQSDIMAYLAMMTVRLIEMRRVLKATGSIYLHCDPTASHYLKILMDGIFGADRFLNEIIWKRTGSHGSARRWGPVHDVLLFYSSSSKYTWNKTTQPYERGYLEAKYRHKDARGQFQDVSLTGAGTRKGDSGAPWRGHDPTAKGRHWAVPAALAELVPNFERMTVHEKLDALDAANLLYWPPSKGEEGFPRVRQYPGKGVPIQDCITDIPAINSQAKERIGYPTQKPVALLKRVLEASTHEGDTVLDPFCGCGTTIAAAQSLGRSWLGIDITHHAIDVIDARMRERFPNAKYKVTGRPEDLEGAHDLARRDKYEFQWWANWLIGAQNYRERKKGSDGGIDGVIYFRNGPYGIGNVIVSVKGGDNVGVQMVRDLRGTIEREEAEMGVLVTLARPTAPMIAEAAAAGFVQRSAVGRRPRLQIATIEELLAGRRPSLPDPIETEAFRQKLRPVRPVRTSEPDAQLALPLTFIGGKKPEGVQEHLSGAVLARLAGT